MKNIKPIKSFKTLEIVKRKKDFRSEITFIFRGKKTITFADISKVTIKDQIVTLSTKKIQSLSVSLDCHLQEFTSSILGSEK